MVITSVNADPTVNKGIIFFQFISLAGLTDSLDTAPQIIAANSVMTTIVGDII